MRSRMGAIAHVTVLLYCCGDSAFNNNAIEIRNVLWIKMGVRQPTVEVARRFVQGPGISAFRGVPKFDLTKFRPVTGLRTAW